MNSVGLWFYEDYASRRMAEQERVAEQRRLALRVKRALRRPKS
jgi:hypothetical protein